MWNDQSNAGGGFFNSPGQFAGANTPGNKTAKSGKRNSRTAPLTISQALRCSDDGVKIWGAEIPIVQLVARVRNIQVQSTRIEYTIEDMTGRMKAIFWMDRDSANEDDKSIPNVMVNTYVEVCGSLKLNQGKKVLIVFKMLNVTNINAITYHYLKCIRNKITFEAKSKGAKMNNDVTMSVPAMPSNSMMNMDMGGAAAGLNPRQVMVFALIRAAKLETGISRGDMHAGLKDKMSKMELDKILEWMCGEGHIYSTIDEDHFRATDAS